MGVAARRVPPDWNHPKDVRGGYIPLRDGAKYEQRVRDWEEEAANWQRGLRRDYDNMEWVPVEAHFQEMTYAECAGDRPDPGEYMPRWPVLQCTHWQMYEEVTEGTPISPVLSSPEALARWMADHDAKTSADVTRDYEEWLTMILQRPLGALQ